MIDRIKSYASAVVCGFLLVIISGCTVTPWSPPPEPTSYVIEWEDHRLLRLIFLPDKRTILWYEDWARGSAETLWLRMRGIYGTHYFGSLWHIDEPGLLPGFRIYPSGEKPVLMEIKVLHKYRTGFGDLGFPEIGDTRSVVILFRDESIRFKGVWLEREFLGTKGKNRLLALLELPYSKILGLTRYERKAPHTHKKVE